MLQMRQAEHAKEGQRAVELIAIMRVEVDPDEAVEI